MRIYHKCSFVENGQLHYIIAIGPAVPLTDYILDGNEKIVHNNTVLPATGGTGVPALVDTNFYTMYQKP